MVLGYVQALAERPQSRPISSFTPDKEVTLDLRHLLATGAEFHPGRIAAELWFRDPAGRNLLADIK